MAGSTGVYPVAKPKLYLQPIIKGSALGVDLFDIVNDAAEDLSLVPIKKVIRWGESYVKDLQEDIGHEFAAGEFSKTNAARAKKALPKVQQTLAHLRDLPKDTKVDLWL